jgi:hypothetical protein
MYYDQGALPVPGRPKMPAYQPPYMQPPRQAGMPAPFPQRDLSIPPAGRRNAYTPPQQMPPYQQQQQQQPWMNRPRYSPMPSGPRRLQLPQGAMGYYPRRQMYGRGMQIGGGRPWDQQQQPVTPPPMMDWY